MTPLIIVLILLAVVAAYFMGFFGGEKVPASSSPASSSPAGHGGEKVPASSSPASSSPAGHGGYNEHDENQFLRNGKDAIWSVVWSAVGEIVTIDYCKDRCNDEPGCDGINVRVKNDDPADVMCWVLNPSDQTTIMYREDPLPGYSLRSYTKTNANYELL